MDGEYAAGTRHTGFAPVDEAVEGLAGLADKPVEEHPAVLSEVHARLAEILGEAGQGDDPGPA